MEHNIVQIDRMLHTFKRVKAHLTSREAARNGGNTRMPPAPDFNVLGKLADTIGYDQAKLITEEAYSYVVALVGDVFNAVFEEPLKSIRIDHQQLLDEHATNDNDRANDRANDRTNSA